MADRYTLRLPALEVRQGSRKIYCFAVDGKRLPDFTAVSRIRRDGEEQLHGYQRPEVANHIRAIRRYLESGNAMLPNAVVLAFDSRVTFAPAVTAANDTKIGYSIPGELIIPVDETLVDEQKPAWLVDGQQRSAAIRDADIGEFPVAAIAFIADDEAEQRSQFILVNNTKPLPKGLIHELLPDTTGHLPYAYARRQLATVLMTRLNGKHEGPFYRIIATPTSPKGYIKDNSILKMIEHSIYEGALYKYRDSDNGSGDVEQMLAHLNAYWGLVKKFFPEAWKNPPRKSRLTHGVGIQAMGFIMDHLTDNLPVHNIQTHVVTDALERIKKSSAWMSGSWNFGDGEERKWNHLQNNPSDVRYLTNGLKRLIGQQRLFEIS
ncbi:DGQHR domain-containing protein DpdB [Allonocardiopsis opalescens]|uniref:DGQHR domain-containing protein n=1 Tax=Allonocardiopsis opalescens TaxID=1144618 RepID=A0A2T0Q2J8_9ACTN|nr:DGQHR domain-containing protein DpdB [Allonocardiopsis opalescens]PRX98022.1 DGQHR domain-containing protein [Allonocardiopsis opalescens]